MSQFDLRDLQHGDWMGFLRCASIFILKSARVSDVFSVAIAAWSSASNETAPSSSTRNSFDSTAFHKKCDQKNDRDRHAEEYE